MVKKAAAKEAKVHVRVGVGAMVRARGGMETAEMLVEVEERRKAVALLERPQARV